MKLHLKDTEGRTYCGRHGAAAQSAVPLDQFRKTDPVKRCINCSETLTGVRAVAARGEYDPKKHLDELSRFFGI
jgi:hypothetical protein